jgi:hypothetical protein
MPKPNHAMEPTASRRTIQLSMSSIRQSAATRPRSRRLILFSLDPAVFPDLDYARLKRCFDYFVEY